MIFIEIKVYNFLSLISDVSVSFVKSKTKQDFVDNNSTKVLTHHASCLSNNT